MYMYIHAPIFYEKIFFPHLNLCKKFLEQEKNCDIIKAKKNKGTKYIQSCPY